MREIFFIRTAPGRYWATPRYNPETGHKTHITADWTAARPFLRKVDADRYARDNGGEVLAHRIQEPE